jgi:CHAD domain-containing protein
VLRKPVPVTSTDPGGVAAVRDRLLVHVDAAIARLKHGRSMTDVDVHEARKSLKRARAILRLLQPSLAKGTFTRCKVDLRTAGRALSAARDARVIADRFDEMLRRAGISPSSISGTASELLAEAALVDRRSSRIPGASAAALNGATAARKRLERASLPGNDWAPLGAEMRDIYRRGRRLVPGKADCASTEALHEWRKQAKSYWHALEVFLPMHPAQIGRTIRAARRLADLLGENHDLALLADRLRAMRGHADEPIQALLDATEARRRQLCRKALKVGTAIYAEPPALMEKQLRRNWQKWRNGRTKAVTKR